MHCPHPLGCKVIKALANVNEYHAGPVTQTQNLDNSNFHMFYYKVDC